jgi:hypothetical protein
MSSWDELRLVLAELVADESRPLRTYPMPDVDKGRTPPFHISLAPWAVEVAAQLDARFGEDVVLTVGALHFPSRTLRNHADSIRQSSSPAKDPLLDPEKVAGTWIAGRDRSFNSK